MRNEKMMGFETPGDKKVQITVREWQAMQLATWRSRTAFEGIAQAALEIVSSCKHATGCPGANSLDEPCLADRYQVPDLKSDPSVAESVLISKGCPDREMRMSALVILGQTQTMSPVDARKPAGEMYTAPSRERFSEVIADLGIAQIQLDMLRAKGVEIPAPPPNEARLLGLPKKAQFNPQEFSESEDETEDQETAS